MPILTCTWGNACAFVGAAWTESKVFYLRATMASSFVVSIDLIQRSLAVKLRGYQVEAA